MTTPRIADEFKTPPIHLRGMVRNTLMPADAPNPCAIPINRDLFDLIIDRGANMARGSSEGKTSSYRFAVKRAKEICRACPVRQACLTVHGPDLELGVVAGFTDKQRAERFGDTA